MHAFAFFNLILFDSDTYLSQFSPTGASAGAQIVYNEESKSSHMRVLTISLLQKVPHQTQLQTINSNINVNGNIYDPPIAIRVLKWHLLEISTETGNYPHSV